jgi:hypothetical protein
MMASRGAASRREMQYFAIPVAGPVLAHPSAMTLPAFAVRWFGSLRRRPAPGGAQTASIRLRQTIVVVGSPELRPPLEDVVGPGAYDVMFIEAIEGAHSRIVQARPDHVILCCDVDDPTGFHLLSMLKADCRTRTIPATTYVAWPGATALDSM